MTMVVTGAAGFIGRNLVERLCLLRHRVIGIDRRPATPGQGIQAICADLLGSDPLVMDALREAEAVFHLAGRPGVRDCDPNVSGCRLRDNVLTTQLIAELVPKNVPLVLASSSSVYGGSVRGRPSRETDQLSPRGGYAISKVRAESIVQERIRRGASGTIARLFTVAGEHQRPDMALALWLEAAQKGIPITVIGNTARTRDITDVRDAVEALIRLAEQTVIGPVNIGTGKAHLLQDVINAVSLAVSQPIEIRLVSASAEEPPDTLADISLLESLTGFAPHTDLAAVVSRQLQVSNRLEHSPA